MPRIQEGILLSQFLTDTFPVVKKYFLPVNVVISFSCTMKKVSIKTHFNRYEHQMFTLKNCSFFILLFISALSQGQLKEQLNFSMLTEKDGLSNKKINSIVQDKSGVIWIGTYNGLNRYDGNRVKSFYTSDAGIPFGEIKYLHASPHGLWICTISQVFYLQTGSEKSWLVGNFTNAVIYKTGSQYKLADRAYIYDLPNEAQIKDSNFKLKPAVKRAAATGSGNHIIEDKQQQPWSFKEDKILRLNRNNFSIEQEYPAKGLQIQMIYFDSQNRCWVASWGDGIFIFDKSTGKFTQVNIEENKFVALGFTPWKQQGKNYLLLSSDNSMIVVDEESLNYQKFSHNNHRFRLNAGFADKDNNLWLACEDGVRLVSKRQDLFRVIPVTTPARAAVAPWVSGVYSIKETNEYYWLSKRYISGIFQYDKNWHLKNYWPQLSRKQSAFDQKNSSEAYDFLEDNGRTYMTTEFGIYIWDGSSIQKLLAPQPDSTELPRLRNIEKQNDSTWWIRSYSNGIYLFNPRSEKFVRHYGVIDDKQVRQPVHYMLRTKKGNMFVTTYDGLYELNTQQRFSKVPLAATPSEYMLGMAEDKNGILWIASSNGLFAFDPATRLIANNFAAYGEMGFCYRVTVDDYNNVWFNCQKGYWCWIQSKQQMLKFGYEMGLPDNRLEAGFVKGLNGNIYAGANDAVVIFDPAVIMQYSSNAIAIITDVSANHSRQVTSLKNDSTQQLQLGAGTYDLRINFSVTDYATPGNYELYYKIAPGNKTWSQGEKGSVNFSSLQHGHYEVTVIGKNNLTGDFSKPYYLLLDIRPYWYQTILFKFALLTAIIALIIFLVKRRINQVRTEAQFRQKIAESEMSVLRSQMNPHFIFNSLNSIENFILQNEKRHATDYLIKFSKLIRTILEINQLQLIPFAKDMEALWWYIELEQIRFPQKFSVNIQVDPGVEISNFNVPPMIVQPFIENAIVHGIAHSKQDGHQLNIFVNLKGAYLQYVIEDDGIGIEKSASFNKLNKPGHKSLGLQITKERIRLHNKPGNEDDIIFMKRQPSGTTVVVNIKIKKPWRH
ncbi:MAG: histidine kinase [Gloeobacteraceae cyanobacterium ES-bin-316]|nr:histidine kinase [Ferruginibacter sp.]